MRKFKIKSEMFSLLSFKHNKLRINRLINNDSGDSNFSANYNALNWA